MSESQEHTQHMREWSSAQELAPLTSTKKGSPPLRLNQVAPRIGWCLGARRGWRNLLGSRV